MVRSRIKRIQAILGVAVDGIWGPKSQRALNCAIGITARTGSAVLERIQNVLSVHADGRWGPRSQTALNREVAASGAIVAVASSFADAEDLAAFKKCKKTGKTDRQCFAVGDNGVGKFGANTAQTAIPMVAIHPQDAIARWGSMEAAAHRKVRVRVGSKSVVAYVEDQLGTIGRIDLNPAAAKRLSLVPPFLIRCTWEWVVY